MRMECILNLDADWSAVSDLCVTGQQQSPVDFVVDSIEDVKLEKKEWLKFENYDKDYAWSGTNNGHTITLSIPDGTDDVFP